MKRIVRECFNHSFFFRREEVGVGGGGGGRGGVGVGEGFFTKRIFVLRFS